MRPSGKDSPDTELRAAVAQIVNAAFDETLLPCPVRVGSTVLPKGASMWALLEVMESYRGT